MLAALRNRDFALLWSGLTVSLIGDGIYFVAIAWQAFKLSDAPTALSIVGVAWTLPSVLFLLIGGVVSDRFDRRSMMLGAAIGQAVAIGSIGVLTIASALTMPLLLGLVALYGGVQAFFQPALEAIVPTLVAEDQLLGASAVDQFVRPLSIQLLGPAIGGVLIATAGSGTAFLVDAATFGVAAGTLLLIRPLAHSRTRDGGRDWRSELAEGLSFVRTNPWLWRTLVAAGISLLAFVGPSQVLLPFLVKNELHASSGVFGAIRAAGGVGALTAAVWVGYSRRPGPALGAMFAAWALQCLALAGYALLAGAWAFGLISLLSGALGAVGNIVWGTLMKTRVPNQLLGRVSSLDWLVSIGLVPLSFAITGPIAQAAGARTTLMVAAVIASSTMILVAVMPGTRAGHVPTPGSSYEQAAAGSGP
jgi:MFS family permease